MAEAKTFDILFQSDGFFDVVVLGDIVGPNGIVDNDAVDGGVVVGCSNVLLEAFLVYSAEVEVKATVGDGKAGVSGVAERWKWEDRMDSLLDACLLRPFCVLDGSRVIVGQESSETRLAVANGLEGLLDFLEEAFSDCVCKNDLAGLGNGGHDVGAVFA